MVQQLAQELADKPLLWGPERVLELHEDFDDYLAQIRRARTRTLVYFGLALLLTIALSIICLTVMGGVRVYPLTNFAWLADPGNALDLVLLPFNIVLASVARYWYLRQDKLMTLLTQAMVIERENEMAIRLLLNKRNNK